MRDQTPSRPFIEAAWEAASDRAFDPAGSRVRPAEHGWFDCLRCGRFFTMNSDALICPDCANGAPR